MLSRSKNVDSVSVIELDSLAPHSMLLRALLHSIPQYEPCQDYIHLMVLGQPLSR